MTYTVSITSQGQISIPAPLRKKLGLDKFNKATIREEDGKMLIEPIKDLIDLKGSLNTSKSGDFSQIRQDFEEYIAQKRS